MVNSEYVSGQSGPDDILFVVDPLCPWCYLTSGWLEVLRLSGVVAMKWAFFSLETANAGTRKAAVKGHARSALALRTLVVVRELAGEEAAGTFYRCLGKRFHESGEPIEDERTLRSALDDGGLPRTLIHEALVNEGTWETVEREHLRLVETTRSFGVPSVILDAGDGPAIFGPILSSVPNGDDAVAMWEHVRWLVRYDAFAELKRDRSVEPDLWSYRHFRSLIADAKKDPSFRDASASDLEG